MASSAWRMRRADADMTTRPPQATTCSETNASSVIRASAASSGTGLMRPDCCRLAPMVRTMPSARLSMGRSVATGREPPARCPADTSQRPARTAVPGLARPTPPAQRTRRRARPAPSPITPQSSLAWRSRDAADLQLHGDRMPAFLRGAAWLICQHVAGSELGQYVHEGPAEVVDAIRTDGAPAGFVGQLLQERRLACGPAVRR